MKEASECREEAGRRVLDVDEKGGRVSHAAQALESQKDLLSDVLEWRGWMNWNKEWVNKVLMLSVAFRAGEGILEGWFGRQRERERERTRRRWYTGIFFLVYLKVDAIGLRMSELVSTSLGVLSELVCRTPRGAFSYESKHLLNLLWRVWLHSALSGLPSDATKGRTFASANSERYSRGQCGIRHVSRLPPTAAVMPFHGPQKCVLGPQTWQENFFGAMQ